MTEEDKKLLLKDLYARLTYETIISIEGMYNTHLDSNVINAFLYGTIENVKPYLFPMSSMTEEQRMKISNIDNDGNISFKIYGEYHIGDSVQIDIKDIDEYFDWLNEHHFDYRGLIDKSLAIDCTNLNIY